LTFYLETVAQCSTYRGVLSC